MCQGSSGCVSPQSDGSSQEESGAGGPPLQRRPHGGPAASQAAAVTPTQGAGGAPVGTLADCEDTASSGNKLPPPSVLTAPGAPKRSGPLPPPPEVPPRVLAVLQQPGPANAADTGAQHSRGAWQQSAVQQAQGWLEEAAEQQRRG